MARKKIVFVIVEGPSDDTALGVIISRLYDRNTVYIKIMHGDITTDYNIEPKNVVNALGEIVKNYANSMHLKQIHFQEIIHLVDMDGAYISDECIKENVDAKNPIYSLKEIQTKEPNNLKNRNKHKRDKIKRMYQLKKVWGSIPYRVYYMSCNLDHVLYGELNCTDDEKEKKAYKFAKKYKNDLDGFLTFISKSDFSILYKYKESWEFIMKDLHSLERYSNFGLCFEKNLSKREYS